MSILGEIHAEIFRGEEYIYIYIFCIFRAAIVAYGGSQATGPIKAVAASQHHSHSNKGSELRLWPTPRLMVTL